MTSRALGVVAPEGRTLASHLAEYKEQGFTVFAGLHAPAWVEATRALLDPEFDRHFALRDAGPFWQVGLYPIATLQDSSTTLYQICQQIQWLFF